MLTMQKKNERKIREIDVTNFLKVREILVSIISVLATTAHDAHIIA